jgi:hypothetical protein
VEEEGRGDGGGKEDGKEEGRGEEGTVEYVDEEKCDGTPDDVRLFDNEDEGRPLLPPYVLLIDVNDWPIPVVLVVVDISDIDPLLLALIWVALFASSSREKQAGRSALMLAVNDLRAGFIVWEWGWTLLVEEEADIFASEESPSKSLKEWWEDEEQSSWPWIGCRYCWWCDDDDDDDDDEADTADTGLVRVPCRLFGVAPPIILTGVVFPPAIAGGGCIVLTPRRGDAEMEDGGDGFFGVFAPTNVAAAAAAAADVLGRPTVSVSDASISALVSSSAVPCTLLPGLIVFSLASIIAICFGGTFVSPGFFPPINPYTASP